MQQLLDHICAISQTVLPLAHALTPAVITGVISNLLTNVAKHFLSVMWGNLPGSINLEGEVRGHHQN